MGLSYLGGDSWNESTREERFFCLQLYNHIKISGIKGFVQLLIDSGLDIPLETNWEIGYEVCFYRDVLFSRNKPVQSRFQKRTFDLCLMSDEAIVVIEAKAAEGFKSDQLKSISADTREINRLTKVSNIKTIAIHSSIYQPRETTKQYFDMSLSWKTLSKFYNSDPILARADAIYRHKKTKEYKRGQNSG